MLFQSIKYITVSGCANLCVVLSNTCMMFVTSRPFTDWVVVGMYRSVQDISKGEHNNLRINFSFPCIPGLEHWIFKICM